MIISSMSVVAQPDFRAGVSVNSGVSYRVLNDVSDDLSSDFVKRTRDNLETPLPNVKAGLLAEYKLQGPFAVSTELRYANIKYKYGVSGGFTTRDPEPNLPTEINTIYSFHFIEVPILIKYTVELKSSDVFMSSGISLTHNIGAFANKTTVYADNSGFSNTTDLGPFMKSFTRRNTINALVRFGWSKGISKKLEMSVSPELSFGLNSFTKTSLKERFWTAGLGVILSTDFSTLSKEK